MAMIEAKKLRKVFGDIEAVRGVSFEVEQGEALGFLGPNGAGKTTVMRMLTCFLTPTSGTATVGGHDILADSMAARSIVGYVPENSPIYGDMTVVSFLRFMGEMRGFRGQDLAKRVDKVVEMCWLTDVRGQQVETLSKGYTRRVGLAQSLIHNPPILILDEPTDGLDPNQKHEVRLLIKQMASEKAIVISTHILEEVDAVCDRAIIVARGEIVADETPAELKRRSKVCGAVRLAIAGDGSGVEPEVFKRIDGVEKARREDERVEGEGLVRFLVTPKAGQVIAKGVIDLAVQKNWDVQDITVESGDLSEVFRGITMKEGEHS